MIRAAVVALVLSLSTLTIALSVGTSTQPAAKVSTRECKTYDEVADRNPQLGLHGPAWRVQGTSHLGTKPGRLYHHQPSVVLQTFIGDLDYEWALAQMGEIGPVYFLLDGPCIVKTVQLVGDREA